MCLQELQSFGDSMDLRLRRRTKTESGDGWSASEEVLAAGINDAKSVDARKLSGFLDAEQLSQAAGGQTHLGAGRLWEILVVFS